MATKPVLSDIPLSFLETFKSLLPTHEVNWSSHGYSFSIEEGIAIIEISDESKFHLSCDKKVMEQFILDAITYQGLVGINKSQQKLAGVIASSMPVKDEKPSWLVDPKQSFYQKDVLR